MGLIVADGLGDEEKDGIRIYDIGKPKNRAQRILFSTKKIRKKAISLKYSTYHFHDPELLFTGQVLAKMGKKVIFDIHENVGEQIRIKDWVPYPLKKVVSLLYDKIENVICRKLSALIVPQPIMTNKFKKYNPNTFLVENFPVLSVGPKSGSTESTGSKTICFHAGSLAEERGLANMVNSFGHLGPTYELHLAGAIQDEVLQRCKKLEGWKKVVFHGRIHFNEVLEIYKDTSIGLILYNNVGQYHLSYAVKLFEYMSFGIPVIMPDFGEWIDFNRENQCGINVDPKDHQAVAMAIEFLATNADKAAQMGKNGYGAIIDKYNWNNAYTRLLNCYETIRND